MIRRGGSFSDSLTLLLSVSVTKSPEVDYSVFPRSIEIPAGQNSVALTTQLIDDERMECPPDTLSVTIRTEDTVDNALHTPPAQATIILIDNERPIKVPTIRLRNDVLAIDAARAGSILLPKALG